MKKMKLVLLVLFCVLTVTSCDLFGGDNGLNLGDVTVDSTENITESTVLNNIPYGVTIGANDITVEVDTTVEDWKSYILVTGSNEYAAILELVEVDSSSVNLNQLGTYSVTYSYQDNDDITQTGSFQVNVVDTTAPVITLNGDETIVSMLGSYYSDESAIVIDNYDTELVIETESNYNPFFVGEYQITYSATDNSGNVGTLTRTVNVVETLSTGPNKGIYMFNGCFNVTGVIELSNGDLILNGSDGRIFRVDQSGNIIWSVTISLDSASSVETILNSSNELVVSGGVMVDTLFKAFIATYDLNGNQLSFQLTDSENRGYYTKMKELSDGTYIAALANKSNDYTYIQKFDSDFYKLWETEIEEAFYCRDIYEETNGNITFYLNYLSVQANELNTYVFTSSGDIVSNISETYSSYIMNVKIMDDKIYILGDNFITEVDSSGTKETFNLSETEYVSYRDLVETVDGDYIFVGVTSEYNIMLYKTDSLFDVTNSLMIHGSQSDFGFGVKLLGQDRFITYGVSYSGNGDFTGSYNVDSQGYIAINSTDFSQIVVNNEDKPTMTLNGYNCINMLVGVSGDYSELGATASFEGTDLEVTIIGDVDVNVAGVYHVYYLATNEDGVSNILRRTVNIYDYTTGEEEIYKIDLYSLINEDNDLYDVLHHYDGNEDGYLSTSEIYNITVIDAGSKRLGDLKYFSLLFNLERLYLDFCEITDISHLSDLYNLKFLYLCDNQITDISPIQYLDKLEYLSLTYNDVSDLTPLNDLLYLNELHLQNNPITDLDQLGNLPSLEYIYADYTLVTKFTTVSEYPNLIALELNYTNISQLSGFNNPNLEQLFVQHGNLTNLDGLTGLFNSPNLTLLSLSSNQITDITGIADLTGLTNLYLTGNPIEDISPLTNLVNLTDLSISANGITDISVISNLTKLKMLYLGFVVNDFTPLAGLTNLQTISISYELEDLKIDTDNRETLDNLIDQGTNILNAYIINLQTIDAGVASVLEDYDADKDGYIDLKESRNITELDLYDVEVHSIVMLDYLSSLTSLRVNDQYIDFSQGTPNWVVEWNLINAGVLVSFW